MSQQLEKELNQWAALTLINPVLSGGHLLSDCDTFRPKVTTLKFQLFTI